MSALISLAAVAAPVRANQDPPDGTLSSALALARRLITGVEAAALPFELPDLGAIDLPPAIRSEAGRRHLRTAATLYLASELEKAMLVPAVETLAAVHAAGGGGRDVGSAGALLYRFWRERNTRFSREERQAFFARLFGDGDGALMAMANAENHAFPPLMEAFADAVHSFARPAYAAVNYAAMAALQISASRLADNLVRRGDGMAAYAARDIVNTIETALNILGHPAVQSSLGARSVWMALRRIARRYMDVELDIGSRITRAKSGMRLLVWLAENYSRLDGGLSLTPRDPIVAEAGTFLYAGRSPGGRPGSKISQGGYR